MILSGEKTAEVRSKPCRTWRQRFSGTKVPTTNVAIGLSISGTNALHGEIVITYMDWVPRAKLLTEEYLKQTRVGADSLDSYCNKGKGSLWKIANVIKYPNPVQFSYVHGSVPFCSLENNERLQAAIVALTTQHQLPAQQGTLANTSSSAQQAPAEAR